MLPVMDIGTITNLIKNFNQLKNQYDLLNDTYKNAKKELEQVKRLARNAEGHYGFGNFFNTVQDLQKHQWSPDTWESTLKGLSGGNSARYQELLKVYPAAHPFLSQSEYTKGASPEQAKHYLQDVQVNRAAMVSSTYAFDNLKNYLNTIYTLSKKIDQAQNTKAAIDLNSRLLTEMTYMQLQSLKMQILLNQQLAQAQGDIIAEKTASSNFSALPQKDQ